MVDLMIAVNAHFDGKVIIPDEPLDLPINQKVRIQVETLDKTATTPANAVTAGVDLDKFQRAAVGAEQNPKLKYQDEDALWRGSDGEKLMNNLHGAKGE